MASSVKGESSYSYLIDTTLGLSLVDRFTNVVLSFFEHFDERSNATLAEFVAQFTYERLGSRFTYDDRNYGRRLGEVRVSEFFASVQAARPSGATYPLAAAAAAARGGAAKGARSCAAAGAEGGGEAGAAAAALGEAVPPPTPVESSAAAGHATDSALLLTLNWVDTSAPALGAAVRPPQPPEEGLDVWTLAGALLLAAALCGAYYGSGGPAASCKVN